MIPRVLLILISFYSCSFGQTIERKPVSVEVMSDARIAVEDLAREVMKGNFLYSLDLMYPRWKEKTAMRVGGEEALEKRLQSVPQEMQKNGISIIDFKVGRPVSAFEVKAGLFQDSKKAPVFSEYLVFVPTTTLYRAIDPNAGAVKRLESKGFQVAISSKSATKRKWTFIDGSNLSLPELRSLFPLLPDKEESLNLPQREMKELGK